jgi:asparagine synthase (glutamine-hydrolysing)
VAAPGGIRSSELATMTRRVAHRGPDGEGFVLYSPAHGVTGPVSEPGDATSGEKPTAGLGHRRLSIIDLSEASSQPFVDPWRRLALSYNGELYNYIELREQLTRAGHHFESAGDTEVVLRAYEEWGPDCADRFVGMWAFAILDAERKSLFLSRDRFGIKPLFWSLHEGTFRFASEIKALWALPELRGDPDEAVVARHLATGLIDWGESTFFAGIRQLAPAHPLVVRLDRAAEDLRPRRYWSLPVDELEVGDAEAVAAVHDLLYESVALHGRSDVPVGTCLSGGLDSSAVVEVAARLRGRGDLPAFNHIGIGYVAPQAEISERRYMEIVAADAGIEMSYVAPDRGDFVRRLPELVTQQDEPFGSASIAAQSFVFERAAAAGLKVMLDGQGADETLGGYHTYYVPAAKELLAQRRLRAYAGFARDYRSTFGVLPLTPKESVAAVAPWSVRLAASLSRRPAAPVGDAAPLMSAELHRVYEGLPTVADGASGDGLNGVLRAETTMLNLPGLLRYEDRNSMAYSIEARVPFLDHRLVEYVVRLPPRFKIRGATTKYVLRAAVAREVPAAILNRRDKIGFRADREATWALAQLRRDTLLQPENDFEQRWFDDRKVAAALAAPPRTAQDEFVLWRLINMKLWLRAHWS